MQDDRAGLSSARLGFGCAGLSLADPPAHHAALLGSVWDAGVRWYDVARSYSYGAAEEILGRFLRGRRDEAVVVSKFGIRPPGRLARNPRLHSAARAVFAVAPGLKRHVTARADHATSAGDFSVEAATRSLEASLRALGTDRLDALLLHEAVPGAVGDDLRGWLEDQRGRGTVLAWGTAAPGADVTAALLREQPWTASPFVQVHDPGTAPLPPELTAPDRRVVIHSVLAPRLPALRARLAEAPDLAARVLEEAGVDVERGPGLGQALLADAAARRPDGVVLFSSRDLDRCRASARALQDVPAEAARAVLALLDDH